MCSSLRNPTPCSLEAAAAAVVTLLSTYCTSNSRVSYFPALWSQRRVYRRKKKTSAGQTKTTYTSQFSDCARKFEFDLGLNGADYRTFYDPKEILS